MAPAAEPVRRLPARSRGLETQSIPQSQCLDSELLSIDSPLRNPVTPLNGQDNHVITHVVNGVNYIHESPSTVYTVGALLGKGGFARVYKLCLNNSKNNDDALAGKVISKARITRPDKKDKISREVEIHKRMKHVNVVRFLKFFEDSQSVFMVMEYCGTKTLSNILRDRKHLTEPEVRYYLKQIISGCQHIHSRGVVHRDLKLSNLFITDRMEVKIGDFGLSAFVVYPDERKESICGTPNYISPEVILKVGHSFPADVWAIGCIIYALLSGRPPFETNCLKDTYRLIAKSKYAEPGRASLNARCLIARCLQIQPKLRPSLCSIDQDPFLTKGLMPTSLPTSACVNTPDFEKYGKWRQNTPEDSAIDTIQYYISTIDTLEVGAEGGKDLDSPYTSIAACADLYKAVRHAVSQIHTTDSRKNLVPVSGEGLLWVGKWVDYSHKYGFGFQLSNDVYGACFKCGFSIAMQGQEGEIGLHDPTNNNMVRFHSEEIPIEYAKKLQVMKYFIKYMDDTLIKGSDQENALATANLCETYMVRWLRTKESITMCLSTGTVQVNFFNDHSKIVVSKVPTTEDYKVMYVNSNRQSQVYSLKDIALYGASSEIKLRLHYVMLKLARVLALEKPSEDR